MSGRIRRLACLLLAWAGVILASPAVPRGVYSFRNYGTEQGLSNLSVSTLAQDPEGFLWVGTEDGLFRFDGQAFQRFGTEAGLPVAGIQEIHPVPGGELWVRTSQGLCVGQPGHFQPVAARGVPQAEHVGVGARGYVFLGSRDGGREAGPGEPFQAVKGLPGGAIQALWVSPAGRDVLLIQGGLLRQRQAGVWRSREAPFLKEAVHALHQDRKGRIWIRTQRGLFRLEDFEGTVSDLKADLPDPPLSRAYLAEDHLGRMWTQSNRGLICFDAGGAFSLGEKDGLPTEWAGALLVDREGSLWMGSEGIHRLQGRFLWSGHTHRQGLPGATVWSGCRTRDGRLWIGTNRGACMSSDGAWEPVPITAGKTCMAFLEDREGGLWVGQESRQDRSGILALRRPGGAFRDVPVGSLSVRTRVGALAQAPDGSLLVGTVDDGLHRLMRGGRGWIAQRVPLPGMDPKEQINQMGTWGDHVWAATGHGLAVGDGRSWARLGVREGFLEEPIAAVARDPGGDLWVAYGNVKGLTRLQAVPGGWKVAGHLLGPETLVKDLVYSMVFDAQGVLWMGTAQGVKRWDGATVERYGRGEGLPGEDCAANAAWLGSGGDVWFGTSNGAAQFHAEAWQGFPEPPSTRILAFLDGAGRSLEGGAAPRVPYRNRNLTFHFTSPSYLNEARITYELRLVGFEDAWRATRVREARYTALPPGSYRFEVRSRVKGLEAGPPMEVPFTIQPPWWMLWWLQGLGGLLLGALVLLAIRARTSMLHRRNLLLEDLVKARTRDLERANEALEEASMVDPLTGLKNRRYLGLSLPEETSRIQRVFRDCLRRGTDPLGASEDLLLLMVDLDHFKEVNDTYGHAAGDAVLEQFSVLLRRVLRESNTLVRWGGEEFLVVARRFDRRNAPAIAGKIHEAMRRHVFRLADGLTLRRTCSIGYAAFPPIPARPEAFTWQQAVEMADQGLYVAKHSGRDRWVGSLFRDRPDAWDLVQGLGLDLQALVEAGGVDLFSSHPEALRFKGGPEPSGEEALPPG